MNHQIYCFSTGEPIDVLLIHVFAYAYRDAWRLIHAAEPIGKHRIEELDLLIDFMGSTSAKTPFANLSLKRGLQKRK